MFWFQKIAEVKSLLPNADVYVFQEYNQIRGFIGVVNNLYIAGLFVLTQVQSQGIGTALLKHCIQIYTTLTLDVFSKNTNAIQFYRKQGFYILEEKFNPLFHEFEIHMIYSQ